MAKIAGYLLTHFYEQEYIYDYAPSGRTYGPHPYHRQCAWEHEALDSYHLEQLVKISLEDADTYVCIACEQKLSVPVLFPFERHEDIEPPSD